MNNIVIDKIKVNESLDKIEVGLNKYIYIMNTFQNINVCDDVEFQTKFNGFYRVRRNKEFRQVYYDYMQSQRNNAAIDFEQSLRYIYSKTNRVEASFVSKLIATINPDMPIWDKYVLENLGMKHKYSYKDIEEKIEDISKKYYEIVMWYQNALNNNDIIELLEKFDNKYPNNNISNTKKLDFILWQTR